MKEDAGSVVLQWCGVSVNVQHEGGCREGVQKQWVAVGMPSMPGMLGM